MPDAPAPEAPARSRRRLTVAAGVVLALAAVGAVAATATRDRQPAAAAPDHRQVTYLTSFGMFGRDAYAVVADERGFFAQENITVKITPGTGGENIRALAAGKAQFAAADFINLVQQSGQGGDVAAVAVIQHRSLAALMTTADSGITAPADLEGRTLAVTPGSAVGVLWPAYARLAGIDADRVTVVNGAPQVLPSLLGDGRADAIGQFVVGAPTVQVAAGQDVNVLPMSDVMGDLYGITLATTRDLIADDPELVAGFRRALLRGLLWSLDNPAAAGDILHRRYPTASAESAAAELELMDPYIDRQQLGAFSGPRVARAIALATSAGILDHVSGPPPTPADLVAFDLAGTGE